MPIGLPDAPRLVVRVLAALAVVTSAAGAQEPATTTCTGLEAGPTRTVTRIIDAETVALDDGTGLRLTGVLAPRAIDADAEGGTWPAESAAAEALRALLLGKSVELGFGGERTDRYGRHQAHAFVLGDAGARLWVQRDLVERGFARAHAFAGQRQCSAELLAAERGARAARRGLWAEAAYQVRRADKPAELLRYRATFQLVEGRVVRVAQVRETIYLNFDRDWRQAFSVSLRRDDRELLGSFAGNPRGLEGRSVRVHGWIEERSGAPVIDLSAAGMIEVDAPPAPGR